MHFSFSRSLAGCRESELPCGSAALLNFLGNDSVARTADTLIPRAATCGALSEREMHGCVVGSPAAFALVSLGALLVNLEAAPNEVPADAAHSPGMRRCHALILPRFRPRRSDRRTNQQFNYKLAPFSSLCSTGPYASLLCAWRRPACAWPIFGGCAPGPRAARL